MTIYKVLLVIFGICISNTKQEKLKVSLYYETLCRGSQNFILNQLYPGYQMLGDKLDIDLVPFGIAVHTEDNGKIQWTCQHGPLECYINKINACAINLNSSQSELMKFVNCVIKNSSINNTQDVEESLAKECADETQLSWDSINSCLKGDKAEKLLLNYENRQNKLIPELEYVPHIMFNDKFDEELLNEATEDFVGTACKLFKKKPKECSKYVLKQKYL